MPEFTELLEGIGQQVSPTPGALEQVARRRDRRKRNRRVSAAALALLIAFASIGYMVVTLRGSGRNGGPAGTDRGTITPSNVGQLRVAWRAQDYGERPAVTGGIVFVGHGEHQQLERAYPLTCRTDGARCAATWVVQRPGMQSPSFAADGYMFQVGGTAQAPYVAAFAATCGEGGTRCAPSWRGALHPLEPNALAFPGINFSADETSVYVGLGPRLYRFRIACTTDGGMCAPSWVTQEFRSVAISGGLAFAASGKFLAAFDADCWSIHGPSCDRIWSARPDGQITDPVVTADGEVYVVAGGRLFAYLADCLTGGKVCQPVWFAADGVTTQSPPVTNGSDVLISTGSEIVSFGSSCSSVGGACSPVSVATTDGLILQSFAVANGMLFIPVQGRSEATVTVFDLGCADRCRPLFTWRTPGGVAIQAPPIVTGGTLLVVAGDQLSALQALPPRDSAEPVAPLVAMAMLAGVGSIFVFARRRMRRNKRGVSSR